MHKNQDGSVSFSKEEAALLSNVLRKADELTDQMEADLTINSGNCEDALAWYLEELRHESGITADSLEQ